jgi:hypothetical protein
MKNILILLLSLFSLSLFGQKISPSNYKLETLWGKYEQNGRQLDAPAKYNVYSALISQSGTADPTAIVLENTLGGTITLSRDDAGQYVLYSPSLFVANKTAITIGDASSLYNQVVDINALRVSAVAIAIATLNASNVLTDAILSNTFIEIRVYK